MNENDFAEIIARALIMVIRAMNARYNLNMWILTNSERREINRMLSSCKNGSIEKSDIERYFRDVV